MRKFIDTKGNVQVIKEEHDDMIATLEQENRQLRARNERLERESTAANDSQVMAMWRASDGNAIRFARMLESYHGIGEVLDATS
jgi:hypothetical protein